MVRLLKRGLLVAAAALLAGGLAAPAAAAGHRPAGPASQAAFGIQPVTDGRPDPRHSLSYSATPGATLQDEVAIVNLGHRALDLDIYATDARADTKGNFALLPQSSPSSELGTWITLGRTGKVHVPARSNHRPGRLLVPFTLRVPANASPGDHAGGIVVSLPGTIVSPQTKLHVDQGVGLRVYTRVSGTLRPGLTLDDLSLNYSGPAVLGNPFGGGVATLHYRVTNTGNVLLGAHQQATVISWLGGTAHAVALPDIPQLLPGAIVTLSARVPGVFPGFRLTGTVQLRPVAPPGAAYPKVVAVSASVGAWAIPWLLIVLLVLLLFAGAGLFAWRLRLRRRPPPPNTSHRRSAVASRTGAGV